MSSPTPGAALSWKEAVVSFPPLRNAAVAALLTVAGAIADLLGAPNVVALPFFVAAIVIGGFFFAREGFEELVEEREVGIEVLMLVAAGGAMALGLFEEAAALVVLYASAEAIEELTFARTRSAIRELLDLAPRQATVIRDGVEQVVAAEALRSGDRFLVRPGEAIPTDGVVRVGASSLNEAPVTGEAVPVEKGVGAEVFAGSVNGPGALEVEATRPFTENTLQRIVQLVEEAQAQKSQTQRFVDRFSDRYSPAVLAAAVLVAVVPPLLGGDWREWFLRAVTLVVAAAPCALVMSVPVAIAAAISRGGREGVLIKGGAQLEALGRVRVVCFDKTGTLTAGQPQVTDIVPLDGCDARAALALAAAIEARSEHPLAQAIVDRAKHDGVRFEPAEGFEALVGHGAKARVDGRELWIGSPALVELLSPTAVLPAQVAQLQAEGKTVTVIGEAARPLALIALRDEPRPEAREAIAQLRRLGVRHIAMLSGDNERTAQAIAAELGLDEVLAELRPEHKVDAVKRLRERYGAIAMVGDGINDAPALATADVGIAMGVGGTDAAIEAADVALMAEDLRKVPEALRLGRRAVRISRQNLIFSIALLAVLIPSAVVGVLTVVIAVLLHEVSELLAVGNGVRAGRSEPASVWVRSPRALDPKSSA